MCEKTPEVRSYRLAAWLRTSEGNKLVHLFEWRSSKAKPIFKADCQKHLQARGIDTHRLWIGMADTAPIDVREQCGQVESVLEV